MQQPIIKVITTINLVWPRFENIPAFALRRGDMNS